MMEAADLPHQMRSADPETGGRAEPRSLTERHDPVFAAHRPYGDGLSAPTACRSTSTGTLAARRTRSMGLGTTVMVLEVAAAAHEVGDTYCASVGGRLAITTSFAAVETAGRRRCL
jgi:hypothetical protein